MIIIFSETKIKIYCFGSNNNGELGLGYTKDRNKPVEFKIDGNFSPIKQIICGSFHTFAICENNKIYCCGYNYFGQLGLGDFENRNQPVEFKIKGNLSPIKQIICGENHTFAICENNKSIVLEEIMKDN